MKKQQIELKLAKSTKGTHMYKTDADVAVTTVYIRKAFMPVAAESVILTVEVKDDEK